MFYLKIHLAFSAHQNPRCVSNKSRFVLLFHIHVAAIILSSKELYLVKAFQNIGAVNDQSMVGGFFNQSD